MLHIKILFNFSIAILKSMDCNLYELQIICIEEFRFSMPEQLEVLCEVRVRGIGMSEIVVLLQRP